ncbi:MAG: hypothetical protein ABJF01_19555 [bacterium]
MFRRIACSMVLLLFGGSISAGAQIGRRTNSASSEPGYWVGISLGYVDGFTSSDEATGSVWRIGYTSQLRATLEKTLQRGATIGVAAAFSNAPMTYDAGATSFDATCPVSCQAHVDLTQYLAFIRVGGSGIGFHGMFNLEGGATTFANFRESVSDAQLQPTAQHYDPTFGFGGGFGYGFSQSAELYADGLTDIILHHQAPGAASQSAPHQTTLRAGFRIGF